MPCVAIHHTAITKSLCDDTAIHCASHSHHTGRPIASAILGRSLSTAALTPGPQEEGMILRVPWDPATATADTHRRFPASWVPHSLVPTPRYLHQTQAKHWVFTNRAREPGTFSLDLPLPCAVCSVVAATLNRAAHADFPPYSAQISR